MRRIIHLAILIYFVLLCSIGGTLSCNANNTATNATGKVANTIHTQAQSGSITDANIDKEQQHNALISEHTSLFRAFGERQQRLTNGSQYFYNTLPGRLPAEVNHHLSSQTKLYFSMRHRNESAPYSCYASCHYYVIALRHIIR